MLFAHDTTPFHDDPSTWPVLAMVVGSPIAFGSFVVYWFKNRRRG